jgi:hypothetical protein
MDFLEDLLEELFDWRKRRRRDDDHGDWGSHHGKRKKKKHDKRKKADYVEKGRPVFCPQCGLENDASSAFYSACGAKLFQTATVSSCPSCGAPVSPGERACSYCDRAIPSR